MGKKPAKAAAPPTVDPAPYLPALQALVRESNEFLLTLYGLQRLPPLPMPAGWPGESSKATRDHWDACNPDFTGTALAGVGLLPRLESWFDKAGKAYAPAPPAKPAPDPIRAAILDLAGDMMRPDSSSEAAVQHVVLQVRSWPGLFLRKFEAKLLTLERETTYIAIGANAALGGVEHSPNRKLTEAEQNIVDALREAGRRLTNNILLTKALGKNNSANRSLLASLVREGILTQRSHTDPRGYGLPDWP